MKNLLKNLACKVIISLPTVAVMLTNVPGVGAAGGNQYVPHVPEDTGLVDSHIFATAAVFLFTVGAGFVIYAKILKNKMFSDFE